MIRFIFLLLITCSSIAYSESEEVIALEERMHELTDKIEQLAHQNHLLEKKLESYATDAEHRFKALETGATTTKNTASEGPPIGKDSIKPIDQKNAKAEFDRAYEFLKNQQYAEAEEALDWFVKHFPKSEYTGNAYYWLGESFAMRKKYDKAAINYIISFNKYPKNSKADLSMIKLVKALNALGKKKEACSTLAKLKEKKASLSPALVKMLQKEETKTSCK